ncbi:outer membrane protein [Afifella pfennigii]|uniref:outer membrane protein n=1 Tax=Afifella pfennigii TaxID=209897 RepID=UPI00146FC506|nr:outer membrane protein [Afifella pfennigii]
MRKLLLSTAAVALLGGTAVAADLPTYEPAPVAPVVTPTYDWTGGYVGLFAGWGWGDVNVSDINGYNAAPPGGNFGYDTDGFYGGLYGGYNFQWNWVVAGLEAEAAWLNFDDNAQFPGFVGVPGRAGDSVASVESDFYGSLTARLGIGLDRVLVYAKGGVAFLNTDFSYVDTNATGTTLVAGTSNDDWLAAWTLGGGVEVAATDNVVVRAEYMYADFGDVSHTATTAGGAPFTFRHELDDVHTIKLGVAWKFGGPAFPVTAAY